MDHRITRHRFLQEVPLSTGLTNDEACRRRQKFGPTAVSDTPLHPVRAASTKFWTPIPWMIGRCNCSRLSSAGTSRGAIIAGLLVFTAIAAGFADDGDPGYFQEGRAQTTLAALNSWNASTVAIIFGKA